MIKKFEKYHQNQQLFLKTDAVILTVSGGRDSVAMVYLFHQAKLNFGIAHCNFNLRGQESDKDEKFVKNLAKKFDVPFFSKSFDTAFFAKENKISTQMAARELRYQWFEEISIENNYQFIATAHHKNDVAETVLINITKGTGLSGLHGISSKNGKIIRPLLCFNRLEIDDFIEKNSIDFREDLSNKETKYVRNKIRHKVIPELEKINPAFIETIYNETQHFSALEQLLENKIDEEREACVKLIGGNIEIDIDQLNKLNPLKTYLYYFLKPFGFNFSDVENVLNSLDSQSGKTFLSTTHQLIKDREKLIISEIFKEDSSEFIINSIDDFKALPIKIDAKILTNGVVDTIKKDKKYAYLNADKLNYPLLIRKWQKGDKFKPFGMKNFKKLSDFFIDEKFSLVDKKDSWLLVLTDRIVWVVGQRIDDDFKITQKTKNGLLLEFISK